MIEIDHKTCEGCQRCCHGTPGDNIKAILQGSTDSPKIDKNHRCEFLNKRNNCYLSKCHSKPIECQLYPIVIFGGHVCVDMSCPAWKSAIDQWCDRFGGAIDDYEPDKEHKFVALWMARMIKEDKHGITPIQDR